MVESEAGANGCGPIYWAEGQGRPLGSVLHHGQTDSDGGARRRLPDPLHGRGKSSGATDRLGSGGGGRIQRRRCRSEPVTRPQAGRLAGGKAAARCPERAPCAGGRCAWILQAADARGVAAASPGVSSHVRRRFRARSRGSAGGDVWSTRGSRAIIGARRGERLSCESLARCGRGVRRGTSGGATPCAGRPQAPERGTCRVDHAPRRSGTICLRGSSRPEPSGQGVMA